MSDVGSDIESICSKCGDVWHVVVAKVGSKIAKVQCKECGALHRHRPPGGGSASVAPRRRSASAAKTAKSTSTSKSKAAAEPEGPQIEADLSRPIRSYSIREAFEAGERVDHPTFGVGVVEATNDPGKMTVYFPGGRKVLAQAKPGGGLQRPTRIGDAPKF